MLRGRDQHGRGVDLPAFRGMAASVATSWFPRLMKGMPVTGTLFSKPKWLCVSSSGSASRIDLPIRSRWPASW